MRWALFFLVVLTASACTKGEFCIEPNAVLMTIDFKTYDSTLTLVDTPLINGGVFNTDPDNPFEQSENGLISANVPVISFGEQQEYIIAQNGITDTILIEYVTTENFISNGCGYQNYFELTAVGHTSIAIDSVKINNPQVNGQGTIHHLEIIY